MKKIFVLMILLFAIPILSQDSKVSWSSFSNGFGVSNSANTRITSSVGVAFDGSTSNGTSIIITGFLSNYGLIITGIDDKQAFVPTVYRLNQNYPNPFNPSTIINFQIPEEGFVTLKVYDILGREVKTLVNENKTAGNYKIDFDAGKLASGVYVYRLNSKNFTEAKKMLLLR